MGTKPDRFVDAKPEVFLTLPPPGEDGYASLCQGGRDLILSAVDVAGGPTHLQKVPVTSIVP